jgi:negative regulator of sigma-B (phosphoserine phosphatase)
MMKGRGLDGGAEDDGERERLPAPAVVPEQTGRRLEVAIGAASRPYPGETANGDAWVVHRHGHAWRVAVVDGLGHGPAAAAAARAALDALDRRPALRPVEALLACHDALGGTRGAAVSIAWIEPGTQLAFAGVGNVEAQLWQAGRTRRPLVQRGIVGSAMPRLQEAVFQLGDSDWVLVLHSDGVSSRCDPGSLPAFEARALQELADGLLGRWGRSTDDATAVVAAPPASHHPHRQPVGR